MSTILVNNVKSYTGSTVTISGSNIAVQGNTTLGDNSGVDTITVNGHITASGNISASGTVFASKFESAGPSNEVIAFNDNLNITGNVTASGNISSSGVITAEGLVISDDASITDTLTVATASIARVSSDLVPTSDNSKDLGSSVHQWRDLYIDRTANIDALAGVVNASIYQINDVQLINAANISVTASLNVSSSTTVNATITTASIAKVTGSLLPTANNVADLGSTSNQWRDLHIDGTANIDTLAGVATATFTNATVQGVATLNTASIDFVSSSLIPYADDTYDLGSSTKQWRNLFIDGTAFIDLAQIDSVSSSLIPRANDVIDLGSTQFAWSKIFVDEVFMTGSSRAFYDSGTKRLTLGTTNIFTGNVSASGDLYVGGLDIFGGTTKRLTLGATNHFIGNLTASGVISGSSVAGVVAVTGPTGSFGIVQSLNTNGLSLKVQGDTIIGNGGLDQHTITGLSKFVGSITASGNVSSSGTITAAAAVLTTADINGGTIDGITSLTAGGDLDIGAHDLRAETITADGLTAGRVVFAGTAGVLSSDADLTFATDTLTVHKIVNSTASISVFSSSLKPIQDDIYDLGSSGLQWKDLYIDGTANVDAISIEKSTAGSQDLASSAIYSVNGSKVEVRAITAAAIADGTFGVFTLFNTSIASDSIVLGSFTGNTGGPITGSILTAATINASTASIQIHNETGIAVAADAGFTASFVVL